MRTGGAMKSTRQLLIFAAGLLVSSCMAVAQNSQGGYEAPPIDFGGFHSQGSASVGYRFTDVKGYAPMYRELFGLERGPRLLDFNMFGEAKEGGHPFVDDYSLSMSGLGGDPFPTAQLTVT